MRQYADGGLRRSVVVEQPAVRLQVTDRAGQFGRGRFPTENECLFGQHVGRLPSLQQPAQMTRHDLEHADTALRHVLSKPIGIEAALARD